MKSILLLLALLLILTGCGAGKQIKVNYETTQNVTVDEAARTKAAGEAFTGIAEAFFAEKYEPSTPCLLNQGESLPVAPLPSGEEICEDCGGPEIPAPDLNMDEPVEATVYLSEDPITGEVVPQRIEFKDAAAPGAECTPDSPCVEGVEEEPPPPRKKKLAKPTTHNSYLDPFGGITTQIQTNVAGPGPGPGSGEGLLLQYLLDEKQAQREQEVASERTKQLEQILKAMQSVMNKEIPIKQFD